jgi:hypothetical protein
VGEYLIKEGFTVYNVNPNLDDIDGEEVYKSLKDIPEKVNIVDVFRRSDALPEVVQEAIDIGAKTVWGQLGVENADARLMALGEAPMVAGEPTAAMTVATSRTWVLIDTSQTLFADDPLQPHESQRHTPEWRGDCAGFM